MRYATTICRSVFALLFPGGLEVVVRAGGNLYGMTSYICSWLHAQMIAHVAGEGVPCGACFSRSTG